MSYGEPSFGGDEITEDFLLDSFERVFAYVEMYQLQDAALNAGDDGTTPAMFAHHMYPPPRMSRLGFDTTGDRQ